MGTGSRRWSCISAVVVLTCLFGSAMATDLQGLQNAKTNFDDGLQALLDGLKAATQQGAGAVKNTAGAINNAAGTIANILMQDLQNNPPELNFQQTRNSLLSSMQTINAALTTLAKVTQASMPKIPSIETLKDPSKWPYAFSLYTEQVQSAVNDVASTFGSIFEGISAKYCIAPIITRPEKKPTVYYGFGAQLEISSGACQVLKDYTAKDLQLDCIRPYVSWKLYPAEYIKKHISPASFISKECKVTKKFGHAINEVTIMTFDKNTKQQEMQNALQQANTRLQSLLQSTDMKTASLKNATQSFVNENQNEAAQMVSKFDDGTVESALSIIDNVLAANNPQSTRKTIQSIPQALGWKVVQQ